MKQLKAEKCPIYFLVLYNFEDKNYITIHKEN